LENAYWGAISEKKEPFLVAVDFVGQVRKAVSTFSKQRIEREKLRDPVITLLEFTQSKLDSNSLVSDFELRLDIAPTPDRLHMFKQIMQSFFI
jgi:hypothetical protein